MKVAFLAVGTELTDGETINSNTSWMAQNLIDKGYEITTHILVPDQRDTILHFLNECQKHANIICVTGGLGPTSDDFTREVIAKWVNKKLVFDDNNWQWLVQLIEKRGIKVREAHRQQCYFPEGSTTLKNSVGTAYGFYVRNQSTDIFVLPGPPSELKAVFSEEVLPILMKNPPQKKKELFTWRCQGVGESEIAEITEEIFKNSGFLLGYKASKPYVTVKVWVPKELLQTKDDYFKVFESKIKHWLSVPNS